VAELVEGFRSGEIKLDEGPSVEIAPGGNRGLLSAGESKSAETTGWNGNLCGDCTEMMYSLPRNTG